MARYVRNRECTRHLRNEATTGRVARHPDRLRSSIAAALLGIFTAACLASPAPAHKPAPSPYAQAQLARQALESRPDTERARRDYERVLELYRAIYHDDPASPKADASIFAVAQLLAEQGRVLRDEKSSHDAIGQYEFLRREYPGSRYRADALLAEGDIYFRDLNDRPQAKTTYQDFLKQYPHNAEAAEARASLKALHADEVAAKHSGNAPASIATRSTPASANTPTPATHQKHSNTVLTAAIRSQETTAAQPTPTAKTPPPIKASATPSQPTHAASVPAASNPSVVATQEGPKTAAPEPPALPSSYTEPPRRKGKLVQVTGVRHWSTSIYTRVAIDLGDEVQYEAARVPDPDRIFFDLHGTRLSPELIGKSVSVIDDGFLKRIRVAQFSNDVTRVVLDVSDVSDYSAFLLPNPVPAHHRHSRPQTRDSGQSTNRPGAKPISGNRESRLIRAKEAARYNASAFSAPSIADDEIHCYNCVYKSEVFLRRRHCFAGYCSLKPPAGPRQSDQPPHKCPDRRFRGRHNSSFTA